VLCKVPHSVLAALWAGGPELAALLSAVVAEQLQSGIAAIETAQANAPQKRSRMPEATAERIRRFLAR
jgi:ABC-type amino acid transport system permease subunit